MFHLYIYLTYLQNWIPVKENQGVIQCNVYILNNIHEWSCSASELQAKWIFVLFKHELIISVAFCSCLLHRGGNEDLIQITTGWTLCRRCYLRLTGQSLCPMPLKDWWPHKRWPFWVTHIFENACLPEDLIVN